MKREFIITAGFDKRWHDLGLDDNALKELQNILLANPRAGNVIQGVSGARKIRFAANEHGKSGGVRVIYVDIVVDEQIFLLTAYPKGVKSDLTENEKKTLAKLIKTLRAE